MIPIRDSVPNRHAPFMVWALIGSNGLVFLFELGLSDQQLESFFYVFGIVPARYTHPEWAAWIGLPVDDWWPFVSSMFLHAGWLHIVGNMWTLWIFGDNVEDRMGPARFLAFYVLCGLAAGLVHWLTNPSSTVPTVGASGAISGVLAAYFVLFPYARIVVLIPILFYPLFVALPALSYGLIWYLTQLFSGVSSLAAEGAAGGVAWWAHLGGFGAGLLLHRFFLSPTRSRVLYDDELDYSSAWLRGL